MHTLVMTDELIGECQARHRFFIQKMDANDPEKIPMSVNSGFQGEILCTCMMNQCMQFSNATAPMRTLPVSMFCSVGLTHIYDL